MAEFTTVAKVGDIPVGEARAYPVGGTLVAIFHVEEGTYRAINDVCPHAGASLATGHYEDGGVTCPWHAWRFSTEDGSWLDSPSSPLNVACYELRVEGGEIAVKVPG